MSRSHRVLEAVAGQMCVGVLGIWGALGYDVGGMVPSEFDPAYGTACGPIACYVACRYLGANVTLLQMVSACDWRTGSVTSFQTMAGAIRGAGLRCTGMNLTVAQLRLLLRHGGCVAILSMGKHEEGPGHAISALRMHGERIVAVGYPQLVSLLTPDDIEGGWGGACLVISEDTVDPSRLLSTGHSTVFMLGTGLTAFSVGLVLASVARWFQLRWRTP